MVFANEGVRKPPYIIDSINNTSGENLYKRRDLAPQRVYAVPYARQMSGMLRDVIDTGTGYGARLGSRQAGGKTGTSQDYRDAWFIGFSADYTTGVWMGNDDNSQMVNVTGGLLPVDAWKSYNVAAHKGVKRRPLSAPNPNDGDRDTQRFVQFYQSLSEKLVQERNLASGISGGGARRYRLLLGCGLPASLLAWCLNTKVEPSHSERSSSAPPKRRSCYLKETLCHFMNT